MKYWFALLTIGLAFGQRPSISNYAKAPASGSGGGGGGDVTTAQLSDSLDERALDYAVQPEVHIESAFDDYVAPDCNMIIKYASIGDNLPTVTLYDPETCPNGSVTTVMLAYSYSDEYFVNVVSAGSNPTRPNPIHVLAGGSVTLTRGAYPGGGQEWQLTASVYDTTVFARHSEITDKLNTADYSYPSDSSRYPWDYETVKKTGTNTVTGAFNGVRASWSAGTKHAGPDTLSGQTASKILCADANKIIKSDTATCAPLIRAINGVGGGGGGLTIGTSTITSGTTTRILYNNAGVVGEYTVTGSGNAVLSASPTFTGTLTAASIAASGQIASTSTGTWLDGTASNSGQTQIVSNYNSSNTSNSHAQYVVQVGGTSAGSPRFNWAVAGGQNWYAGIKNASGSTDFSISVNSSLNGGALTITTGNNATFGGSITTSTPGGSGAGAWKLGTQVTRTCTPSTTVAVEVDIGGTLRYIVTCP